MGHFSSNDVVIILVLCLILFLSLKMDISEDPVSSGNVMEDGPTAVVMDSESSVWVTLAPMTSLLF